MKKTGSTVRIAYLGVLTALAFIMGYLESLIPSFTGIPGVKAGFANIITMISLFSADSFLAGRSDNEHFSSHKPGEESIPSSFSLTCTAAISVVRILLGGITYNGMSAILYGLAGAFFSIAVMYLLAKLRIFSLTAISVAGAVSHNLGQTLLAVLMLGNAVVYYLPMLIIAGLISGIIIGIIAGLLIHRI